MGKIEKRTCSQCGIRKNEKQYFSKDWSICIECSELKYFVEYGNDYQAWRIQSNDLWIAANCIREKRFNQDIGPKSIFGKYTFTDYPEFMLRGFSFECLFKAVWLKKGNKIYSEKGELVISSHFKHHNLIKMANEISFNLNKNEEIFFKILSHITKHLGRYPVVSKFNNTSKLRLKKEIDIKKFDNFKNINDYKFVDKIREKLQSLLKDSN